MFNLSSPFRSSDKFAGMSQRVFAFFIPAVLVLSSACSKEEANSNSRKREAKTTNSRRATENNSRQTADQAFLKNLPASLTVPDETDEVGRRLLTDYGAMFVARGGAVPPPVVIFADEAEVNNWQAGLKTMRADFGGIEVELQTSAMTALMEARSEARKSQLDITARGTDAARRSYAETVRLWQSRVDPGLSHWAQAGQLTEQEAARIRLLLPREQIPEILRLEAEGLYFSKDFSKSILYSVAAPGASQHLSMLAFDVKENEDATVRAILARHGWFQTVSSDTPHFTFLGVNEGELPSLGLKKVTNSGRVFWVPNMD
jgi:hypothetical protein